MCDRILGVRLDSRRPTAISLRYFQIMAKLLGASLGISDSQMLLEQIPKRTSWRTMFDRPLVIAGLMLEHQGSGLEVLISEHSDQCQPVLC